MRNKIKIFCLLSIFSVLAWACEERINWENNSSSNIKLVVEGMLTNEKKHQSIKLSQPLSSPTDKPSPATGAMVIVSDNSNIWRYTEKSAKSGIYLSDSAFRGAIGLTYKLLIVQNGLRFEAQTSMAANSPMESIQLLSVADSLGFYEYRYQNSVEPSMLEVFVDWSKVNVYPNISPEKKKAELWFYTLNSIDVSEIFKPQQTKIYFPKGTKIVRRKYSLNDEEQKFVRSLLLETEWRGGLFDTSAANVNTNISGNAAGYFGAYTLVSDSLVVQ